jgi:CheY-like chemotaxis protein
MAKEILIADSDKANQKEFKKIFDATDYNVVFSENGEEALLRIKLFKPDLIIAGASLKEKSGLEVYKAIKADLESKKIPVVLLSNVFKEISEEDRKRVRADGIITTPFQEDEILNLVDRLMGEEEMTGKKEGIVGREMELKSIADIGKAAPPKEEELLLDELTEGKEEEIIELVEVLEEPELKMSIHDFVAPEKETPFTEITPLESWEKLMEEEKPADRRFKFAPDEKERAAKGMPLQLGEEVTLGGEGLEKELLEKIELEEILQKVEQLSPSLEKEWPSEKRRRAPEAVQPAIEEPSEKYAGLAEFEAALKRGVGAELPGEEAPPLYVEKQKREAPEEITPTEVSLDEELKAVEVEEFPESLLEELGEEELKGIEVEELKEERMEILEEAGVPKVEEEEIRVIEEPEEERAEIFEELEVPEVLRKEVRAFEKPKEERFDMFEEVMAPEVAVPEVLRKEVRAFEKPKEERFELFEEVMAPEVAVPEVLRKEVRAFEKPKEERIEMFEEVTPPELMAQEVTAPIVQREEMIPPLRAVERQMEEVISKGAREMMEGFITKLVPEMTQSIINLTIDRIERMVKEIVPELAEKMIQEEIKRLQKGEKD